jgi:hypothetical protein
MTQFRFAFPLAALFAVAVLSPIRSATPSPAAPGYHAYQKISPQIELGAGQVPINALPAGIRLHADFGVVAAAPLSVQRIHRAVANLFETRATVTPAGDLLLMFPDGAHYHGKPDKQNDLLAYRSRDGGRTWEGPTIGIPTDYNHHGFIPLIPRGTKRLYSFGTQAIWSLYNPLDKARAEDCPIGYFYSDDDGRTWTGPEVIKPVNDPDFRAMSVVRMCETESGTWLIGSHQADWGKKPLQTHQYILRSADRGKSWEVLPKARPGGWQCPGFGRMDETTIVDLGGGEVFALSRTPEGRLWHLRSLDDGKTWSDPAPTPLIHPDAPAMLFKLPDGKTLAVLHHNRSSVAHLPIAERAHLSADHPAQRDRAQLWVSLSHDGGRTWDEPRFLLANALLPFEQNSWYNYQCSYADLVPHQGKLHLFIPHRWRQVLHFTFDAADLARLPTAAALAR